MSADLLKYAGPGLNQRDLRRAETQGFANDSMPVPVPAEERVLENAVSHAEAIQARAAALASRLYEATCRLGGGYPVGDRKEELATRAPDQPDIASRLVRVNAQGVRLLDSVEQFVCRLESLV